MPIRCTGKREKELTQLDLGEIVTAPDTQGKAAELAKVERGKAQQAPPDQSTDPVRHSFAGGVASAARPAYSQRRDRIKGCVSVFNVLTKDIAIIKSY